MLYVVLFVVYTTNIAVNQKMLVALQCVILFLIFFKTIGSAYTSSCCSGGCNEPYGSCVVSDDHREFSCDCSGTILFTGSHCTYFSSAAIGIIISVACFILLACIIVYFYIQSLHQKQQLLEELADGLLNHDACGDYTSGGVNSEYIAYMQQALILNDVFVRFEEIKLESIVGEGSFGVVHKATFRGAQV